MCVTNTIRGIEVMYMCVTNTIRGIEFATIFYYLYIGIIPTV